MKDKPALCIQGMARKFVRESIIEDAAARLVAQIMTEVADAHIAPRDTEISRLQSRVEELERALAWQPIETAPKDGTEILALIKWPFQKDVQRRVIYWSHSGNCVISAYLNTWMCVVTTISQREDYICGWMPLPPAPDEARTTLEASDRNGGGK